ncbi:hypothetical protein BDN70DRAFT_884004 [Pholiota conissans]|uniref:F-box domain-containing protein n=1 Tax=Pholiota conissans TaxID=109636 RepID=A0A9P5YTI8_9AGAR|nr:hypothetical protein BDN70DRAFT_884004 [Pholiota conissans]
MFQPSNQRAARLDSDILCQIFSINSEWATAVPSEHSTSDAKSNPLTETRRYSHVCSFWRQTLLDSPTIWGNCLDLDLLRLRPNEWRHEVLRRSSTAPLVVKAQFKHYTALKKSERDFAIEVISDHWERIKVLDISGFADVVLTDKGVRDAFCRPAPLLNVFYLRDAHVQPNAEVTFDDNYRLFGDDAPMLSHFYVAHGILSNRLFTPMPPFLYSSHLRHLKLGQEFTFPAVEFADACAKMNSLERLSINVASKPPEHVVKPSFESITLPNLKSLDLISDSAEIFPHFLGRLNAKSLRHTNVCTRISNDVLEITAGQIQHIITDSVSTFFSHFKPTYLELFMTMDFYISIQTAVPDDSFKMEFCGSYMFTVTTRQSFIRALLALDYPSSLTQFRFLRPEDYFPAEDIPSLAPVFLELSLVTELYTTAQGLNYIVAQETADNVFFESVHTIILVNSDIRGLNVALQDLQSFLAKRQRLLRPIQVLDIRGPHRTMLGDLQYLENITGLKVMWEDDDDDETLREYICGSGDPSCLAAPNADDPAMRSFFGDAW